MKQLKINNRDYVFVPVPDGATDISVGFSVMRWGIAGKADFLQLPFTEQIYVLIADTKTITEEQAVEIVEKSIYNSRLYLNYQFGGVNEYALDSFKSLLKHHSITGRHAIIEKI
jgi:hypothetical protein